MSPFDLPKTVLQELNAALQQERYQELERASQWYREQFPASVLPLKFLFISLVMQDRFDEALKVSDLAIQLAPNDPELYLNCGNLFVKMGDPLTAKRFIERALMLNPESFEALHDLAEVCRDIGLLREAKDYYKKAIDLQPRNFPTRSKLIFMLFSKPREEESNERKKLLLEYNLELKNCPGVPPYTPRLEPQIGKIRLGFVSGDLRSHSVGYFLESFLSNLEQTKIDLFAYPTIAQSDSLTERIRPLFSEWRLIHEKTNEEAVDLIRRDNLHILFDLSGHTNFNRLPIFGWRVAPIQVSWLGYFATTGLSNMDYILADPHVIPFSEEHHFVEEIWRMPETYLCFSPPLTRLNVNELPARSSDSLTFGCFNSLIKINDEVIRVWSQILIRLPTTKLFLKTKLLSSSEECQKITHRFIEHGVSEDRLILEGWSPRNKLLESYHRVDITLDPFPYPGGTTSAESLWMGVPVLTMSGKDFLSRVGESVLTNAGLPEWIAQDENDYIKKAVDYASESQRLSSLRLDLRSQVLRSPLFDAPRFARDFEAEVTKMWNAFCSK